MSTAVNRNNSIQQSGVSEVYLIWNDSNGQATVLSIINTIVLRMANN